MDRRRGTGDKPVVIRMSEDLHAAIKQRADDEERSMAQTIRRALMHYLEMDGATA